MLYPFIEGKHGIFQTRHVYDERDDVEDLHCDNSQARSDDISSDSSIFEDIDLQNPEKQLNLSVSDDTFCSSESTAVEGVTILEMSSHEEHSSLCHSDTFDTHSGMNWDDCSVMSQVGNKSSDTEDYPEDDACSFVVSLKNGMSVDSVMSQRDDIKTPSIATDMSFVQDSKNDGDKDKITRKTQFDLLMKHWREKERDFFNRNQGKTIRNYDARPKAAKTWSHV